MRDEVGQINYPPYIDSHQVKLSEYKGVSHAMYFSITYLSWYSWGRRLGC